MTGARPLAVYATLAAALVVGCGPKRVPQPAPPSPSLIILLEDPGTGTTGRARVSNEFGAADLTAARHAAAVTADRRPGSVRTMSEADVKRMFGSALAALPPTPRHFTLYFQFESDHLTDQSRALLPEIQKTVKGLAVPEVLVIGHTDTMGSERANLELGLKRATLMRNLLVAGGLDPALIEVASHGEADPLVRTPNETAEPRNRRVEIAVR
jgi:peptidoglycan-associated lipoprotein